MNTRNQDELNLFYSAIEKNATPSKLDIIRIYN